jgi:hypothetical protein
LFVPNAPSPLAAPKQHCTPPISSRQIGAISPTYHMDVIPPCHSDAFCAVGGSRSPTTPPMVHRSPSKRQPPATLSHPAAAHL